MRLPSRRKTLTPGASVPDRMNGMSRSRAALSFVVVFQWKLGLVEADVEVVVEVAAVGGVPPHGPAHPLLEPLDARQRRAGYQDQGGVAGMQVRKVADIVCYDRTSGAALILAGEARLGMAPHEVVHDQLAALLEQIKETRLPIGPGERVFLVDLDHRQGAAGGIENVFRVACLLLLSEQMLAGGQPLIS